MTNVMDDGRQFAYPEVGEDEGGTMKAVDRLRRDHQILRSKLSILESALTLGPEAWFVLREVCFTLSRQLRDHIKREEDLVAACRKAMTPALLAETAVEHKDEPALLRTVNRLFLGDQDHLLERIAPAVREVIRGLRHHMDEEEAGLFPVLERTLAEQDAGHAPTASAPCHVDETMTVNRVVQEFPRTKPVFDQLFVSVPVEGCACLDEVAWRHGMEARELLKQLEGVIASCGCAK